jgi:hypothetical protein
MTLDPDPLHVDVDELGDESRRVAGGCLAIVIVFLLGAAAGLLLGGLLPR